MRRIFKIALALILLTISFACFNALTVKAEQETEWCGYYELQYDLTAKTGGGLLKLKTTTIPSGKLTKAVVIDDYGNTCSLGKQFEVNKTENTIFFYGLEEFKSTLTQGNDYKLILTGNNGVGFEVAFTFLSKAIITNEDVRALDIYKPDLQLDGYYILLNDLVLEAGQENQHVGLSSAFSYTGFSGTFDGQGHSITFDATNGWGFFGKLVSHKEDYEGNTVINSVDRDTDGDGSKDTTFVTRVVTPNGEGVARDGNDDDSEKVCLDTTKSHGFTIKNVGFVDCKVTRTAVVAGSTNVVSNAKALIKDVYIRTSRDSNSPNGTITPIGSIWTKLENVFIECPDQHVSTSDPIIRGRFGSLYGHDGNLKHGSRNNYHQNVFIVADVPVIYQHPAAALRPGEGSWYTAYGENEGKAVDWANGVYVLKNVYKYLTHEGLRQANHNFSSFNSEYWDFSLGIPMWKSATDRIVDTYIETDAYVRNNTVTLTVGKGDFAQFGFGYGNVGVACDEIRIEIIRGEEFINLDNQIVNALFTPEDTTSVAKIKVTAIYHGNTYENEYTVLIMNAIIEDEAPPTNPENPNEPENPDGPENPNDSENGENDQKGGCGTVAFNFTDFGGGAFIMLLCASIYVVVKKMKNDTDSNVNS